MDIRSSIPVALMGDRWFLGQIHGWPRGGEYFGVPWTNFAGWYLVTAVTIGVNQAIDSPVEQSQTNKPRRPSIPYMHLGGFALFVFIVGFNLFMTAWLREWTLFLAGLPLAIGFLLISWHILAARRLLRTLPSRTGRFGRQNRLEHVLQEDAAEKDFPIDRVVPHRVFRIVLDHGPLLENLCLKHEIDMDRPLENLRRKEGFHASAD